MKHIKTFEGFVNEAANTVAAWDATNSEITFTGGIADPAGIRCENGKLVAYYEGGRGHYTNDLGIKCDPKKWEANGKDIVEELNNDVKWLGGVVSRPIDAQSKREVVAILKKNRNILETEEVEEEEEEEETEDK
jgi:hypothetical protein